MLLIQTLPQLWARLVLEMQAVPTLERVVTAPVQVVVALEQQADLLCETPMVKAAKVALRIDEAVAPAAEEFRLQSQEPHRPLDAVAVVELTQT
jgi:hypothetical protein